MLLTKTKVFKGAVVAAVFLTASVANAGSWSDWVTLDEIKVENEKEIVIKAEEGQFWGGCKGDNDKYGVLGKDYTEQWDLTVKMLLTAYSSRNPIKVYRIGCKSSGKPKIERIWLK
jgi:hypothetical protein